MSVRQWKCRAMVSALIKAHHVSVQSLIEHFQMTKGSHGCGRDIAPFTFVIVVAFTDAKSALIK